jgi:hypothetical protein
VPDKTTHAATTNRRLARGMLLAMWPFAARHHERGRTHMTKRTWKPVFAIIPKRTPTGKDFWMRIGTAFENSDGSWNIDFAALPKDGRCQVRNRDDKFDKPHALDPAEKDPFDGLPVPPVMQ